MKVWDEKLSLKYWDKKVRITRKIDGVNAIRSESGWLSRAGKPLYNLPSMPDGIYEVYLGNFKETISACRTHTHKTIWPQQLFMLSPYIDERLDIGEMLGQDVEAIFKDSIRKNYEGLVIYADGVPYKLKQKLTFDCTVVDIQPGTGKYTDNMGALVVNLEGIQFKVGTGFTDKLRHDLNNRDIIGKIIEVEAMEVLPSGKLRHPRFVRVREDLK